MKQYVLSRYSNVAPHDLEMTKPLPKLIGLLFLGKKNDTIHLFGNYFIERTFFGNTRDYGLAVICRYLDRYDK